MNYRDILKEQLQRRQELNPQFSLRSFAKKLGVSPSKISEVLSGKKKLSVGRLEELAERLNLRDKEKEIFLISGEIESSKVKNKEELERQIKKAMQELNAEKTTQRNAWYFGAVKALEDNSFSAMLYHKQLGLTELQIENATRYLKRIRKFHPDRRELIYEPTSLGKKIYDCLSDSPNDIMAEFAFLNEDEIEELNKSIRRLIRKRKYDPKSKKASDLKLVYFGISSILREGK